MLFWKYITNLNINKSSNIIELQNKKLINQFNFIIATVFFTTGIRDLLFSLFYSSIILIVIGVFLVTTLFFTTWRFNKFLVFFVCFLTCFIVFGFSSFTGRNAGIDFYYFSIMISVIFLFNINEKKEFSYVAVIYITIILLFSINIYTDYQLLDSKRYTYEFIKETQFISMMNVMVYFIVSIFYLNKKSQILIALYNDKLKAEQIIATLKKKVNEKFDDQSNSINLIELAMRNELAFIPEMKKAYPEFYNNLLTLNHNITHEEFKFCAMIRLGFSTKDISEYTYLSVRSIQSRKYRLRKQYNIPSNIDLTHWMNQR